MYKKLFLALATLIGLTSTALAGPGSTGGGNGIGSTLTQVNDAIGDSKSWFQTFVRNETNEGAPGDAASPLNPANVKNAKVKEILLKWFTPKYLANGISMSTIGVDALVTGISPQPGPCLTQSGDRDASTGYELGSPICMSTDRLSRFPNWALNAEIVSLLAHEFAHHFGYDENDAQTIQNYFFNVYGLLVVQNSMINVKYDFQNFISAQTEPYNKPVLPEMAANICKEFYMIEGLALSYSLKPFAEDFGLGKPTCAPSPTMDAAAVLKKLQELDLESAKDFNL
jgi:hypothetical protein